LGGGGRKGWFLNNTDGEKSNFFNKNGGEKRRIFRFRNTESNPFFQEHFWQKNVGFGWGRSGGKVEKRLENP